MGAYTAEEFSEPIVRSSYMAAIQHLDDTLGIRRDLGRYCRVAVHEHRKTGDLGSTSPSSADICCRAGAHEANTGSVEHAMAGSGCTRRERLDMSLMQVTNNIKLFKRKQYYIVVHLASIRGLRSDVIVSTYINRVNRVRDTYYYVSYMLRNL
jgi:hypothetical protein